MAPELFRYVGDSTIRGITRLTGTLLVATVAMTLFLISTWWVLIRMVCPRIELMAVWISGSYLAGVSLLTLVLLDGWVIRLDTRVVGVSLTVTMLVSLSAEVTILMRTQIFAVEPTKGGSADRSWSRRRFNFGRQQRW